MAIVVGKDSVSLLPDHILSKIFLNFELEDVLTKFVLVSKSWYAFLTGNSFWEPLIHAEFGELLAGKFIFANGGNASSLRKLLFKRAFARDLISQQDIQDFVRFSSLELSSSERFIVALTSRPFPDCGCLMVSRANSADPTKKESVFFVAYLPHIYEPLSPAEILPFYFRITILSQHCALDKEQRVEIAFFGKYFELLDRKLYHLGKRLHELTTSFQCKTGTCYILAKVPSPNFAVRFLMPSHWRQYEKFQSVLNHFIPESSSMCLTTQYAILCQNPAIVNWSINGVTPLMVAAGLKTGNNNSKNICERRQLQLRCRKWDIPWISSQLELVQALLALKADPHRQRDDVSHATALYYAVLADSVAVVETLLFQGVDPNMGTDEYKPLFCSIFGDHFKVPSFEISEMLVRHGANVNTRLFDSRDTMLIHAVQLGNQNAVRILLYIGADPCIENRYGQTAFDHCPESSPLLDLLLKSCRQSTLRGS